MISDAVLYVADRLVDGGSVLRAVHHPVQFVQFAVAGLGIRGRQFRCAPPLTTFTFFCFCPFSVFCKCTVYAHMVLLSSTVFTFAWISVDRYAAFMKVRCPIG